MTQKIDWNALYHSTDPVDWDGDLVAIHPDGRVQNVELAGNPENPDHVGDYYTTGGFDGRSGIWRPDGFMWCGDSWRIRNRTEKPANAPSPELVERMVAYISSRAACGDDPSASAILADLPQPVDPVELTIQQAMESGNDITAFEIAEALRDAGLVKRVRAEGGDA
ncbi:hypothetical protein [Aurantiacibacter spongiae]|uniref:Uncharacterized protein n=1 Tax=Aurantiacibacter spongiae TaxID=2488860 RepID=A0A3N5CNF7_9SPHN|nr:hypothetical protein [Aurantiacibacter spongiae]RPF70473.1 hypothetical protein EG799_01635 [Aurantiacibacter spongiae]